MDLTSSSTPSDFQLRLRSIKSKICLQETEDTWDAIATGINSLRAICESDCYSSSLGLIPDLRELQRPLINAMSSERTRLSGAAIDLIVAAATSLGTQFEALLPVFFPSLLCLCGRANKVVATRSRTAVLSIIETTQLPAMLPHLSQYSKDKAASLRLIVAEGTLACLNCCNPPDLEKNSRVNEIEAIMRASARDSNADVRKAGKRIFEAYKILLPWRVDIFTAPLTPTIRKYLDLKSSTVSTVQKRSKQPGIEERKCSTTLASQPSGKTIVNSSHIEPSRRAAIRPPETTTLRYVAKRPIRGNSALGVYSVPDVGTIQSKDLAPHQLSKLANDTNGLKSASRLIRPKLAANSRPKNESKMQTTNLQVSGPRRIPLPETSQVKDKMQPIIGRPGSRNEVLRPDASSKSSSSRNGPSRPNISLQYKNDADRTEKSTLASSRSQAKLQMCGGESKQSKMVRSLTQPTLSQLARVKRPVERKAGGSVGTKPLWGRPSTRREAMKVSPKKNHNMLAKSSSHAGTVTPNGPAEIPLPSSPVSESEYVSQAGENLEKESPEKESLDDVTEIFKQSTSNLNPAEAQLDIAHDDGANTLEVESTDDPRPAIPELSTPKQNMQQSAFNVAATNTPISALLESIEQGFQFTPSSPMSPPQPYLTRGPLAGMTATLNIPFHLAVPYGRPKPMTELTEGFD